MTLNRRELLQQGNRGGWETMASMLPDDVLVAQAAHRGYEIKKLAVDTNEAPMSIQRDIETFLNSKRWLETDRQLFLMRDVLAAFGQSMPIPNYEQLKTLTRRLDEHQDWRVIPAKLDDPWNRRLNTKRLGQSPLAPILPSRELLWGTENQRGPYSEVWTPLWKPGGGPVRDKGWIFDPKNKSLDSDSPDKLYDLRYRTPEGRRYVDRAHYLTSLLVSGQAVLAEDGAVWTFPVMDVSDRPAQKGYKGLEHSVAELHKRTDSSISPEALINLHLLYRIIGQPKDEDVSDMTNEVISEVDEAGNHQAVAGVVFVTFSNKKNLIRVAWENSLSEAGDFQAIEGVSGIGLPSLPPQQLALVA